MTRAILDVDTSASAIYGSEDLAYLQRILEEMCSEVNGSDRPLHRPETDLRLELAAALFKAAENGERDHVRLKQQALRAVVPRPDPSSTAEK
jgi:hypothetical protein